MHKTNYGEEGKTGRKDYTVAGHAGLYGVPHYPSCRWARGEGLSGSRPTPCTTGDP